MMSVALFASCSVRAKCGTRHQQKRRIWKRGSGVDRATRPVKHIVHEVEYALPRVPLPVTKRDLNFFGKCSLELLAVPGECQETGLAHVEIQVNRIERDECRQQCRRDGRRTTAGNEVAYGNEMRADSGNPKFG
jgi:hypothetical protein